MENEIITGKERTVFFRYLIPSMLSMLAVSAYSFVDTFVVGQGLGAQAVAAMGVGTPVVSILYALGFLLGAGGAVNYSVAKGSGDICAMAAYGLRCYAPAFIFMSVSILLGIYFQSEVRALPSLMILLGRSAVFPIILLYLLAAALGGSALWAAIPAGEGIAMLVAAALYWVERRKL